MNLKIASDFKTKRIVKLRIRFQTLCVVLNEHQLTTYLRKMSGYVSRSLNLKHFFGGHKAVARPDPFPNSAVKHSIANGSGSIGSARVGCRQIFP